MMKFLFSDIPWDTIKAVGFDMDGTLYDEFEFITQVYQPIAALFSKKNTEEIKNRMQLKWLEKGSSYPFIFSEILMGTGIDEQIHESMIREALTIFRNFKPQLSLNPRMKFVLETFKKEYDLFLVSDGSSALQWNKIHALKLELYFDKKNIFISGDHGKNMEKPALAALQQIAVLKRKISNEQVVFIGDREKDKEFAKRAGFYYIDIQRITGSIH